MAKGLIIRNIILEKTKNVFHYCTYMYICNVPGACLVDRDDIFKLLRSPGIDSTESILSASEAWAGICSRVKGWKIDSWNRLGNKYGIEVPMSHVHVKINFSYRLDSWNRCLSVQKRLQIRALAGWHDNHSPTRFLGKAFVGGGGKFVIFWTIKLVQFIGLRF